MDIAATLPLSPQAAMLGALCAGTAAVLDLRTGRIPNLLTYPCLLAGLALGAISGGLGGLGLALAAMLAGGGVFLAAFLIGAGGGGDVKLMAALGAITGAPLAALDLTLASLIVGGVLSVLLMLHRTGVADLLLRLRLLALLAPVGLWHTVPVLRPRERHSLRFGLAAALGFAWIFFFPALSPLTLSLSH